MFISIRHVVEDHSGDTDTSNISSYINGKKAMPGVIGQKAAEMDSSSFCKAVKKELIPKIVNSKKAFVVLAIKELINPENPDLKNINRGFSDRYTADSIVTNNDINFAEFLSNILFYVLTQVSNFKYKKIIGAYSAADEFKKLKTKFSSINFVTEDDEDSLFADKNLEAKYRDSLYIETRAKCPRCPKGLAVNEGSSIIPVGHVVKIDPQKPYDADNLIMLCPSCAASYESNITKEKIEVMKGIKKNLVQAQRTRIISDSYDIKEGIELVLKALPNGKFDFNAKGNLKPVSIQEKLSPGNEDIIFEAKNYLPLFKQVDDSNQTLQDSGNYSFEIARQKINCMYKELKSAGRTKKEIYEELIDCLDRNSNGGRPACIAVATYFIQKCDVFDANTK